jgi:hypothetical protein
LEHLDMQWWDVERGAEGRFTAWAEARCGRKVGLGEAERLLTEAALVVQVGPRAL